MLPHLAFDIENDNSKRYLREAGNFLYDQIVAWSAKAHNHSLVISRIIPDLDVNFLTTNLTSYKVLVGHHLKHDLLFIWKEIQEWLEAGGKIWCTQLAECILTGQQTKYAALRVIAVNKYGCEPREKLMEKYWIQGYQTSQIDKEIVVSDVKSDALEAETIFLAQYEEAKRLGLLELIEFQMDALLATTEMEFNGFKVDRKRLQENWDKLELEKINLEEIESKLVKKYMDIDFYRNKPRLALHTLLFGGKLKTIKKCPVTTLTGELCFVKSGPNKGAIKTVNKEISTPFKGFAIKVKDTWKTEKGNVSIDETTLSDIIKEAINPDARLFAEILLKIRRIEKEISTYYQRTLWLTYDCDDCVHAKYHHTSTNTGRLSASDPNMQNQPKTQILEHFITRFPC